MTPASAIVSIALVGASAIAALWASRGSPREERPGPERAILERRVEALERLVRAGGTGHLIPFEQGLVVIGRPVLEDLLEAALPYETVADDRFRIRILSARVSCDDGVALVRLDGRASFLDQPEDEAFVEATVYGALREFDLEREEHVLRGRVDVIDFEVHRVMVDSEPSESLKGLIRDLAALRVETLRGVDYTFDVPVKLVHEIVLPEMRLREGVRIPSGRVPLQASVTAVTALEDRLWISIRLRESLADSAAARAPADTFVAAR